MYSNGNTQCTESQCIFSPAAGGHRAGQSTVLGTDFSFNLIDENAIAALPLRLSNHHPPGAIVHLIFLTGTL